MSILAIDYCRHAGVEQDRREKEENGLRAPPDVTRSVVQRKFAKLPRTSTSSSNNVFLRKKFKDPITNEDFVVLPWAERARDGHRASAAERRNRRIGRTRLDRTFGAPQTPQPATAAARRRSAPHRGSTGAAARQPASARDEQEQGSIDSPLQRPLAFKRMDLRLYTTGATPGAGAPGSAVPVRLLSAASLANRGRPGLQPKQSSRREASAIRTLRRRRRPSLRPGVNRRLSSEFSARPR